MTAREGGRKKESMTVEGSLYDPSNNYFVILLLFFLSFFNFQFPRAPLVIVGNDTIFSSRSASTLSVGEFPLGIRSVESKFLFVSEHPRDSLSTTLLYWK